MTEQFINGVYDNCIDTVLENIDEPMREETSLAYKKNLLNRYEYLLRPDDDINMMISVCTDLEMAKWKGRTTDSKLSILIEDKSFNKLIDISNIGFEHAKRKLKYIFEPGGYVPYITQDQAFDYISEMEDLFEKVQPYNKAQAKIYLREGTLDFSYASDMDDYMSRRIERMLYK